jgi:chloramphenicol 3-O phosphotransferase
MPPSGADWPTERTGHVIILNGASSSGKSSIAQALLARLDPPHFHLAVDAINSMRSRSKTRAVPDAALPDILRRTRAGFHRAVAGMALAGNDVVMDYVFSEPWRLRDCLTVLSGLRVILVAVRCDLEELEKRERHRTDREEGLARAQVGVVHAHGDHDIEVWSDRMDPNRCAEVIAAELPLIGAVTAFDRLRQRPLGEAVAHRPLHRR